MSIIVQKFGGTSVADADKILAAARRAIRAHEAGNQVVVVVSAMGKTTDQLIDLSRQISSDPPAREMDLLLTVGEQTTVSLMAMAIVQLGHQACGVTGPQLGIKTDSAHTTARIQSINTDRIRRELAAGKIVVAAGFQGVNEEGDITTLGRGGSDTTAVALAAELGASCEINTDVEGVYTVDPRLVPTARKMNRISYEEMLELASLGAGVMHSRSIEFAKKFSVPVHVRSSMRDTIGTEIGPEPEAPGQPVCGTAIAPAEARVTILGVPDHPGTALKIFSAIAEKNVTVDMVVQNQAEDETTDISFTVLKSDLNKTLQVAQRVTEEIGAERVTFDDDVAKVSVVGLGMKEQTGVASRTFRALADAGINIIMISTSVIKISVLVASRQARAALWAVHQEFGLDKPVTQTAAAKTEPAGQSPSQETDAAIRQELELAINEDLSFEEPQRDQGQALITISGVPDKPGLAASVFEGIASEGIMVDMIVQDAAIRGHANLSFTVPREDLAKARDVAAALAGDLGAGPVSESSQTDILSVAGVGLRSHTGVAMPIFRALAGEQPKGEGINVRLINTSEVCVSVVVDAAHGEEAISRLKSTFKDKLPG